MSRPDMLAFELVMFTGEELVTDSVRVARHFKKAHNVVLRAIDRLECSHEFRLRNFAQTVVYRENPSGGAAIKSRAFTMTKDGFMFLVMGFTGPEAARTKEAYINAFNQMAESLAAREQSLWKQLQAVIAKEVESKVQGRFGSRLMLRRRTEKRVNARELSRLESEVQPPLFRAAVGKGVDLS